MVTLWRRSAGILMALVAFGLLAHPTHAQIAAVARTESASVVEIETHDQAGKSLAGGTGFIVRADSVL
jgi:hypothetical protein